MDQLFRVPRLRTSGAKMLIVVILAAAGFLVFNLIKLKMEPQTESTSKVRLAQPRTGQQVHNSEKQVLKLEKETLRKEEHRSGARKQMLETNEQNVRPEAQMSATEKQMLISEEQIPKTKKQISSIKKKSSSEAQMLRTHEQMLGSKEQMLRTLEQMMQIDVQNNKTQSAGVLDQVDGSAAKLDYERGKANEANTKPGNINSPKPDIKSNTGNVMMHLKQNVETLTQNTENINTGHRSRKQPAEKRELTDKCTAADVKTIAWKTDLFDYPGREMFRGCEFSCCSLQQQKVLKNPEHADVLVFDAGTLQDPPPPRSKVKPQAWVFSSMDPPGLDPHPNWNMSTWNRAFNWTLTYRSDSDIIRPFMSTEIDTSPPATDYEQILALKDKKVIWLHGRCKGSTDSKSHDYAEILNKYIDVDLFGLCGETGELGCNLFCHSMFERYKFVLVFEHILCLDYISEQFCETLQHNIVPVVRGRGNYGSFVPQTAYINTADFTSIESLGQYLNYLDLNSTAYVKYLSQKEGFRFNCRSVVTRKSVYCDLCEKAHNIDRYTQSISDVYTWLTQDKCTKPSDLLEHSYQGQE